MDSFYYGFPTTKAITAIPRINCVNGYKFKVSNDLKNDANALATIKKALLDWTTELGITFELELDGNTDIAMGIIYSSLSSMHIKLLLESGVKTLNKEKMYELTNFIYYKISTIIKTMLANMRPSAFLPSLKISRSDGQLSLVLK